MTTSKLLKISKRVAIILLIAVFSLAGIVACGGAEDIAGSRGGGDTIVEPGPTGPTDPTDPEEPDQPEQPTFPADTYYKIYAPWVQWREEQAPNGWVTNVSWQDTNTLSQIWKQQIEGGKYNDDRRWFIRDAANRQNDHRVGNTAHYYYFDKNFDLVYYRQGKGSLTVRKFRTGLIVKYSAGRNAGTWSIGGLYETVLTKDEITSNGWDSLNIFMGADHMGERNKGCLAVLTMNTGYDDLYQNEFGVDHYYATAGNGQEVWYDVNQYTSRNPEELDKFLNVKGNLSWKLEVYNFRFVFNRPYDWHLTEHINQQGWH